MKDMLMNNEPIEQVETFKYLGYVLRNDLKDIDDI